MTLGTTLPTHGDAGNHTITHTGGLQNAGRVTRRKVGIRGETWPEYVTMLDPRRLANPHPTACSLSGGLRPAYTLIVPMYSFPLHNGIVGLFIGEFRWLCGTPLDKKVHDFFTALPITLMTMIAP